MAGSQDMVGTEKQTNAVQTQKLLHGCYNYFPTASKAQVIRDQRSKWFPCFKRTYGPKKQKLCNFKKKKRKRKRNLNQKMYWAKKWCKKAYPFLGGLTRTNEWIPKQFLMKITSNIRYKFHMKLRRGETKKEGAEAKHWQFYTWKCGLFKQWAIRRNNGTIQRWNSGGWVTSKTSSDSPRNITSFELLVIGQYFNNPLMMVSASLQSFSTNWVMQ